jgi:type II secretory pathway component GspD/PulD (secretin)
VLKYLFGQENVTRQEVEIVFAITPHIVRAEEVTEENGRLIDLGTGNTVGLRFADPPKKPVTSSQKRSVTGGTPVSQSAPPVPVAPH